MPEPRLTREQQRELEAEAKDREFSEQAYNLMQKAFPGKTNHSPGPDFIKAEVFTQTRNSAGTWLRLQVGEGYDWSRAELKTSHKQLSTSLEKLVEAQIAVFKLGGHGR